MRPVRQRDDEVGLSGWPVLDPDDLQLLAKEEMVRMRDGDRFTTWSCEQGRVLRTLRVVKGRSRKACGAWTCGTRATSGWRGPTCSMSPRPRRSMWCASSIGYWGNGQNQPAAHHCLPWRPDVTTSPTGSEGYTTTATRSCEWSSGIRTLKWRYSRPMDLPHHTRRYSLIRQDILAALGPTRAGSAVSAWRDSSVSSPMNWSDHVRGAALAARRARASGGMAQTS